MLSIPTPLTPYLIWIKIGLATLVVGVILWAGIWFRGVLSDRDKFEKERNDAIKTSTDLIENRNQELKLRGEITDAIKNIKVNSNTYIRNIENSTTSSIPDGVTVVLIPGGVPETLPDMPVFSNGTASRKPSLPK
jgi:hypothetical protein